MPTILVTKRDGTTEDVDGESYSTVMEAIRHAGIDELLALCGGYCSCATCHVYVDADTETDISPMNDDENALLDSSSHRNERSRLSCQIRLDPSQETIRVTIAPED